MKAILLMAGIGRRLGQSTPKCLLELPNVETILGRQLRILKPFFKEILGVVGFKKELIMEKYPDLLYVYNPFFTTTNTAKSLLFAMKRIEDDDVVWINGDVIFIETAFRHFLLSSKGDNAIAVEFKEADKEAVKFSLDDNGYIQDISKDTENGLGEAVGIYKVSKESFSKFLSFLKKCNDEDYFEKAIQMAIRQGMKFKAIDIGINQCVEVDFTKDLNQARIMIEDSLRVESSPRET